MSDELPTETREEIRREVAEEIREENARVDEAAEAARAEGVAEADAVHARDARERLQDERIDGCAAELAKITEIFDKLADLEARMIALEMDGAEVEEILETDIAPVDVAIEEAKETANVESTANHRETDERHKKKFVKLFGDLK